MNPRLLWDTEGGEQTGHCGLGGDPSEKMQLSTLRSREREEGYENQLQGEEHETANQARERKGI